MGRRAAQPAHAAPLRADVLWLALVPLGLVAYCGFLALDGHDALAPFHAQEVWFRSFAGPFVGAWDGVVAAVQGARQLLSGAREPVFFTAAGGDPFVVARHNIELLVWLGLSLVAVAGVLRRLPAAYGAYVVAALALPLSYPVGPQPLMSLPRFVAVLFPLAIWLAVWMTGRVLRERLVIAGVRRRAGGLHGHLRDVALGRVSHARRARDARRARAPGAAPRRRSCAPAASPSRKQQADAALREEIAYYREHHDLGVDAASLALLRARCADVLRAGLERAGADVGALAPGALRDALLASLRFRPFDEVPAALAELRAAGHRLVVVSNWDVSLHEMLRTTGLDALVDAAISSAEAGERKPSAGIFRRALGDRRRRRSRAPLHAGDSLELDVAGARAAGLDAVLVARDGVPRWRARAACRCSRRCPGSPRSRAERGHGVG